MKRHLSLSPFEHMIPDDGTAEAGEEEIGTMLITAMTRSVAFNEESR
jgi:hypothetical protein